MQCGFRTAVPKVLALPNLESLQKLRGSAGFLLRSPRLVPSPRYFAELDLTQGIASIDEQVLASGGIVLSVMLGSDRSTWSCNEQNRRTPLEL